MECLIQKSVKTGKVVIILILDGMLVNIGEDFEASLLEVEGNSQLFVTVFADAL